ncbi:MAG: hypothetical protein RMM51_12535 [Verrucomicrobiae bacterium]|nr:hypothetical protein [Verrucomicrobiae bacterium]
MLEDANRKKLDQELAPEDVKRGYVVGPFRTAKSLTRSRRRV